jgi:hypothetical protein
LAGTGYKVSTDSNAQISYAGNTIDWSGKKGVAISGTILQSATWSADSILGQPYVVTGNITVNAGVTLTIEPGTVVKFDLQRIMTVNGVINAQGTSTAPIYFTSLRDDSSETGGDTNGDAAATQPSSGNWQYVRLNGGSSSASILRYIVFRYGGYSSGRTLYISDSSPVIDNCTFGNFYQTAIYVDNDSGSLESVALTDNTIIGGVTGIYVLASTNVSMAVSGNTITGAGMGISVNGAGTSANPALVTNNVVTGGTDCLKLTSGCYTVSFNQLAGTGYKVSTDSNAQISYAGNTIDWSGKKGVAISGNIVQNINWSSAKCLNQFYEITGTITVNPGVTLTIEPETIVYFSQGTSRLIVNDSGNLIICQGVVFKMVRSSSSYNFYVYGKIVAMGTEESPVHFTAYRDDTIGGNINGLGEFEQGMPGDWSQIRIDGADLGSYLDHCEIRYGGYNNTSQVHIRNSSLALNHCDISYGVQDGVVLYNSNSSLEDCSISSNNRHGVYLDLSPALIHYCGIWANTGDGIFNYTPVHVVNAEYNWWGDASGPGGVGPGAGDEISDGITYDPWLSSFTIPTCIQMLSPSSQTHSEASETGSFVVETATPCAWTAESNSSWIAITAGQIGAGDGAVAYCVQENPDTTQRVGSISVGGETFTVVQSGLLTNLVPIIDSISGPGGVVGSEITITGSNFGADQGTGSINFFDGVTATDISYWSDTEIVCTIPTDAQSGCVTITTDQGMSDCYFISVTGCVGDIDTDHDVDGSDLAHTAVHLNTSDLELFALEFGRGDCF